MRAVVFGQSGMRKDDYLREVLEVARTEGKEFQLINLGQRMAEKDPWQRDPEIYPTISDSEREILRRCALESVITDVQNHPEQDYVLNAHAVFKLDTGLIPATDYDLFKAFSPDVIIVLIDDFHFIHRRLKETAFRKLSVASLLEWRDAEINAAKTISQQIFHEGRSRGDSTDWKFYVLARGHNPLVLNRLFYERQKRLRIYSSFAITGATDEEKEKITAFKQRLAERHIVFDPYKIAERSILNYANFQLDRAAKEATGAADVQSNYENLVSSLKDAIKDPNLAIREEFVPEEILPGLTEINYCPSDGEKFLREDTCDDNLFEPHVFPLDELRYIEAVVDGQIISRDYLLIDQSELLCAFVAWKKDEERPNISAGSQSELTYARLSGRAPLVVSEGAQKHQISPWITKYASEFFTTLEDMEKHLEELVQEKIRKIQEEQE